MLKPLNTEKNRQLNLVNCEGEILKVKQDIVYFTIKKEGGDKYYKCEKGFFEKNFKFDLYPRETPLTDNITRLVFAEYSSSKK